MPSRRAWILSYLLSDAVFRLVESIATHHLRLSQKESATVDAPPYQFKGPSWERPTGDFVPQSRSPEHWPREQQKWRERLMASSESYSAELKKTMKDNDQDTFLWRNAKYLIPDNGTTLYWNDICNGTNVSKSNKLPGDVATINASDVLRKWEMQSNRTCSKFVGDEYNSPLEALVACGSLCDAIAITECGNQKYRLCAIGQPSHNSSDMSCYFRKPETYVPPSGMPRPPQETKFWEDFCKYRVKGKKLRILWESHICASAVVKELTSAHTPVECNEVAAQDSDCSEVFDFRFGDGGVDKCRCVKKTMQCSPTGEESGNVWVPIS